MSGEPEWLTPEDALFAHEQLIAAFGGAGGVRDMSLLDSAMSRARHVYLYESQDLFVLATSLAHGIAKNHPFVDGNKRVAFVLARMFLGMNGIRWHPPETEAVVMIEGLASSTVSEAEFARWMRKHPTPDA